MVATRAHQATSGVSLSGTCNDLIALRGDVSSFEQIFFFLLNGAIRSEGYIECLMEVCAMLLFEESEHRALMSPDEL